MVSNYVTFWKKQSYGDRERSVVARGSKWVEGERWNMGDGGQEDHSVCYCNGGLVTTHLSKPMKRTVQEWTLWTLVNYNVSELNIFTMWSLPPDSTHSKRQFTLCPCISSATSSTGGIVSQLHSTHLNYPLQHSGLESCMEWSRKESDTTGQLSLRFASFYTVTRETSQTKSETESLINKCKRSTKESNNRKDEG